MESKGLGDITRKNGEFVANMERILDVYKRLYDQEFPVVCMYESPKQLIEEGQPSLAMKPGWDAKVDYEYIRHGMVNIFIANEPLMGKRFVEVTAFKTKKEWAAFVKRIADEWYPKVRRIILVMDNYKTFHVLNGQCLNRHISTLVKIKEEVDSKME